MTGQRRNEVLAAIDDLYASRQAALEAEKRVAKMIITGIFETLDEVTEASGRPTNRSGESLMTLEQVAAYLHCSKRTIQEWIANSDFPVRRCGADPRFDRAEVDEWTIRHRKNTRSETAANDKVPPLQRDCKRDRSKANVSL